MIQQQQKYRTKDKTKKISASQLINSVTDLGSSAPSKERQPVVNKCVEKYSAHTSHITAMLRVVSHIYTFISNSSFGEEKKDICG